MGAEKACKLRVGRKVSSGTALLETDYLLFRGEERLHVPFADVRGVTAKDGVLHLSLPKGDVALELGAVAARWAEKIARPKGIVEKLGVKAGAKVSVVGTFEPAFVKDVEATGARMVVTMLHELRRRDGHLGLVSMCAGGGMGSALVLELL